MKNHPLVSVVIASYNMAHYLGEAVDSVINQDYPNVEIIIVDDGSNDNTQEVLGRFLHHSNVTVISQDNAGQTVAKNRGLAEAQGVYVGFCDADNVWMPDKLSHQVPLLEQANPPGVVYGDVQWINDRGTEIPTPPVNRHSGNITGKLLASNFVTFNTCLVSREIIESQNGFDESLSMAIDYDLWLRISVEHEFLYSPKFLVRYRIWEGQMSHRVGERLENAMRMMTNFLERFPDSASPAEVRHAWAFTYTTRGHWNAREGRRLRALNDYLKALRQNLFELRTWKSMVKTIMGIPC